MSDERRETEDEFSTLNSQLSTLNSSLINLLKRQDEPFWVSLLLSPLFLLSQLYRVVCSLRLLLYSLGLLRRSKLDCHVISVGNLTLGGTGKTPMVMAIAKTLTAQGYRVAILSRGYQRKSRSSFEIVADEKGIQSSPLDAGDEPYLMAQNLPGIPVLVGKRREVAGRVVRDRYGVDVLLLDDGFQYLPLEKSMNIVMVDSRNPFGNGHLFPRGILREPLSSLKRADAIILTKCRADKDQNMVATGRSPLLAQLREIVPTCPIFLSHYEIEGIFPFGGSGCLPVSAFTRKFPLAFCGIASPEEFFSTLEEIGVKPVKTVSFPDHYWFTHADLRSLEGLALSLQADSLITTEKDAVRFQGYRFEKLEAFFVKVTLKMLEEDEERWLLTLSKSF